MHIFFKTDSLSLDDKLSLLDEAHKLSTYWWVDKLDCSESWQRQRIDMSFEDIKKHLDDECHFTVIHRVPAVPIQKNHGEIGFSTMDVVGINLFLWIDLEMIDLYDIVEKFNLPKMGM